MAPKRKISLEDTLLTSTAAARLLGITQQYFNTVVRAGWIKATDKGRYRLIDVIQGYKAFLQDEGRRTSKSAEASRVQAARADQIELQTAKERRKLVEIEDSLAWQSEIFGILRTRLAGLAAACTRDLELRAVIEKNLNGLLEECRDSLAAAGRALRSGGPVTLGPEDPDA